MTEVVILQIDSRWTHCPKIVKFQDVSSNIKEMILHYLVRK